VIVLTTKDEQLASACGPGRRRFMIDEW